ncbi:MAG: hypothetical protein OEU92_03020 [Alphaproteobacteria bacterium]|nr:hypothetical protein [Alphaproteobacteria bacterium]
MLGMYRCLPAILLVTFGAALAHAAERSQFTCTSGNLVRRVIVDVGDLSTGLPCEVVYWKDKEAPGVRRVLWTARSDAAFCDGKAKGLVDKLANAGWRCDNNGEAVQTGTPAANVAQQAAPTPAPSSTTVPTLDAATVAPTETAPLQPQPQTPQPQTTAALSTTAPATSTSTAPSATGATTGATDVQTAAVTPETTPIAPPIDQLQTVIQGNLASLNQSVDGDFQAQIGDFGDLNADGIEDAVVFFNYESSTADFTQFVAAYLFNGESYHLAATKPVGGTDLAVRKVEVEDIVNGSIQLRLLLNDASQTEGRRAAMVLKDGQLVETQ